MGDPVEARIRELFATILQVAPEAVTDETHPAGLQQWDSMQHLMLVSGFEEELGVAVEPEEAVEMYSDFATFKRIVLQKIAART